MTGHKNGVNINFYEYEVFNTLFSPFSRALCFKKACLFCRIFFKKRNSEVQFYSPLRLLKIIAAIKSIEHGGDFWCKNASKDPKPTKKPYQQAPKTMWVTHSG